MLEAEVVKNPNGGIDVTVCQCGDSDFIVVNEQGKVVYATKDIKKEKVSPDSERTKGLLGIGSAFNKDKFIHTVVEKRHFDEKVFLIVCSDGLSDHYRNVDRSLNRDAFEKSIQTGKLNKEPDLTNPLSLNCFTQGASLRNAAFDAFFPQKIPAWSQ